MGHVLCFLTNTSFHKTNLRPVADDASWPSLKLAGHWLPRNIYRGSGGNPSLGAMWRWWARQQPLFR